jgi:hypothetical protein
VRNPHPGVSATKYTYDAIRPWLATGTVILWQGDDLLGRAIRLFTEFSHASLVVRELDPLSAERVDVIEALATGLEMRHLSDRIAGFRGRVFAFRPLDLTSDAQARVKSFALDECGKGVRYDYAGLFANALGRVSQSANRYFCSEFAAGALEQGGIARVKAYRNGKAARPGDIPMWFDGVLREIEVAA